MTAVACTCRRQGGIALLIVVITLALIASAYYFSTISLVEVKTANLETTQQALKQAKAALLRFAAIHPAAGGNTAKGKVGYLPCPHISNATEGGQDGNCNNRNKNTIGYLPWNTLDTGILRDGSGSCLWYAVSGSYKNSPDSQLINEDTNGMFEIVDANGDVVVGSQPQDRVVAVVFAPGAALGNQARNIDTDSACGKDVGNISAYLEGNGVTDNAEVLDAVDNVDRFVHATLTSADAATPYNDYFVTITRRELWQPIMANSDINTRLRETTEALAMCLAEYANTAMNVQRRLPWPASLEVTDASGNVDYRDMADYSDVADAVEGYAGRFPFDSDDSNAKIGLLLDEMISNGFCQNLAVTGGVNVDLVTPTSEHRILLNNWKDHFFYAVSKSYSLTKNTWAACSGDCLSVINASGVGTQYAAIVFFGGSPLNAQLRDTGDRKQVGYYLENGNDTVFPDAGGNGVYNTAGAGSNDLMYCLTTIPGTGNPITVVQC